MKSLNLHQCDSRLRALKAFIGDSRDDLVGNTIKLTKDTCYIDGIPTDRPLRGSSCDPSFDEELAREKMKSLGCIGQEISVRFYPMHEMAHKFVFLTPPNLLDESQP